MDLAIMADETLELLSATGAFDMATRREIADSRIGVGVPHGKPTPSSPSVSQVC